MAGRLVIIGANGQLGSEFAAHFPEAARLHHADIEVADRDSVTRALEAVIPPRQRGGETVVVNTAAHNLVDECEQDAARAFAVNAAGAEHVAGAAAQQGAVVVHFSTDYVFDGAKGAPYVETDPPRPVNVYGRSKLAGEEAVRRANPRHYVVRVGALYGPAPPRRRGENFVNLMLRRAAESRRTGEPVCAVDDQWITPTFTRSVVRQVACLLEGAPYGLYHATNDGGCTWFEFAREIFSREGVEADLRPIPAKALGRRAPRPRYTILENRALRDVGLDMMEPWPEALVEYLEARRRQGAKAGRAPC